MPTAATGHARRRGGRSARRVARAQSSRVAHATAAPYVRRRVGPFELLDEEGLALIERNADRILSEIGMEFRGDPEVLEVFRGAGAETTG